MGLKREKVRASSPITSTAIYLETPVFCMGVEPGTSHTWNLSVNSPLKEVLRPNKELAKSSHLRFYVTSHLRLGLVGGPFHSLFPVKICMHFSLPPHVPHAPAHVTVLDTIMGIFWEEYKKLELLVMRFSRVSRYFLSLGLKCLPQHSIIM